MSIEKIIYRAATCNMGESTDQDGDNYRSWAESEIRKEYPEAAIEVLNEDSKTEVYVTGGPFSYESCAEWDGCQEWLSELWGRCPWTGEHFE